MTHKICLIKKNKISLTFFICIFFFTLSLFIAPFTIKPYSLKNLNGRANWIDFREIWDDMPFFPRMVYLIGDFNCHQKYERSFILNGNQMPMCARDIGIFIGMSVGFFVSIFITPSKSYVITALHFFPKKMRYVKRKKMLIIAVAIALVAPALIDGFFQFFTTYESMNLIRCVTGMLLGAVVAGMIATLILTLLSSKNNSTLSAK